MMACGGRESCVVEVFLKPGAKRSRLISVDEGRITVSVTAPASENKANNALIKFLAGQLRLPKSACAVVKGHRSRHKKVAIAGMDPQAIAGKLDQMMKT
ncbi:MAG: DUF167 domain-containing protein [Chitinivibrionales bacterium]|nr:DUF167 domain-containing protein [Chitinivibrionales bacterium]